MILFLHWTIIFFNMVSFFWYLTFLWFLIWDLFVWYPAFLYRIFFGTFLIWGLFSWYPTSCGIFFWYLTSFLTYFKLYLWKKIFQLSKQFLHFWRCNLSDLCVFFPSVISTVSLRVCIFLNLLNLGLESFCRSFTTKFSKSETIWCEGRLNNAYDSKLTFFIRSILVRVLLLFIPEFPFSRPLLGSDGMSFCLTIMSLLYFFFDNQQGLV